MARTVGMAARSALALAAASFLVSMGSAQAAERERVIVGFKAGAGAAVRAEALRQGGRIEVDLADLDAVALTLSKAAIARLAKNPNVDYVEPDAMVRIQGFRSAKRAAPAAVALAGTQTVPYGITLTQADQITGTPAWTPKICIVDSGIDGTHEDLAGNTLAGANYTTSGSWNTDEGAHGTHVAGTVAALDNTVGVVGVAGKKQLNLYIAKVFDASGSAPNSIINKGITGCVRAGANVISMSLGGPSNSRTQQRAVDRAFAKGILLVAASGNAGTTDISYPAGYANVMSVAAVDSSSAWASFSQFNAEVEIAGPGVAVESTIPPNIESRSVLTVGGASVASLAMAGSPRTTATGPLADFGLGTTATPGAMTGKVCLISRGEISFAQKVLNCTSSGGIGAVIYNNTAGELLGTMGDTVTTIPSAGITQADGAALMGQLGASTTLTVEPDPALYMALNGTSMATPHVSAIAALVWSYFPSCTAEQIRSTLKKSALDIDAPGRDDKTGAGLVQAKAAYDRIATLGCAN